MKKHLQILLLIAAFLMPEWAKAQSAEADSVDVIHYGLSFDMSGTSDRWVRASAEITYTLTRDCGQVTFDLICDTLYPVSVDGVMTRGFSYDPDLRILTVQAGGGQAGDTHVVLIPYITDGYVENYGWGGLHLDNGMYYNLGVAFKEYPHTFGRSTFPCRDNFYDKATYTLSVTSRPGWRALCSGIRLSEETHTDGTSTSVWSLDVPTPTYLVSIASAPFRIIEREYEGLYGSYPALLGFTSHDSTGVQGAYDILNDVIPMYERAFGPYRWGRVGYIATAQGSMEHANNICLYSGCMASEDNECQMTICHELGHAWFGNLVTCASQEDMWFNEGGATFCEEVATEAAFGREAATDYYRNKLKNVILSAHIDDLGYHALTGMSQYYTYGTTTYQKGALMWHSLRGILGDSLFYASMQRLFANCAFGNIGYEAFRDSLIAYTGKDLRGFFDFHIGTPGFVDYAIDYFGLGVGDLGGAVISLRQALRGTDQFAHGNLVPVTFFTLDHQQRAKRWIEFDGEASEVQPLDLPFYPAYAIVNLDHDLALACTDDTLSLTKKGLHNLGNSFCKVSLPQACDQPGAWIHVGHHFTTPVGQHDTIEGLVRMANRYWEVTGSIPYEVEVEGRFLYNQGSNGASGAAFIDQNFYERRQTLDSIYLLYRRDAAEAWSIVSHQRASGSTVSSGYFVSRLFPGQYTLAVMDTSAAHLAIRDFGSQDPVSGPQLKLFPNPAQQEFRIDMGGYDKNFDLYIYDISGKKVLQMSNLHDGSTLHHNLTAGSYIVLIQNKFLSLQSQIIIQ